MAFYHCMSAWFEACTSSIKKEGWIIIPGFRRTCCFPKIKQSSAWQISCARICPMTTDPLHWMKQMFLAVPHGQAPAVSEALGAQSYGTMFRACLCQWGGTAGHASVSRETRRTLPRLPPVEELSGHAGSSSWSPERACPGQLENTDSSGLPSLCCRKTTRYSLQNSGTNLHYLLSGPQMLAFVVWQRELMSVCYCLVPPQKNVYSNTKVMSVCTLWRRLSEAVYS